MKRHLNLTLLPTKTFLYKTDRSILPQSHLSSLVTSTSRPLRDCSCHWKLQTTSSSALTTNTVKLNCPQIVTLPTLLKLFTLLMPQVTESSARRPLKCQSPSPSWRARHTSSESSMLKEVAGTMSLLVWRSQRVEWPSTLSLFLNNKDLPSLNPRGVIPLSGLSPWMLAPPMASTNSTFTVA